MGLRLISRFRYIEMMENRAFALAEAISRIHLRTSLGIDLKKEPLDQPLTAADILVQLQVGNENLAVGPGKASDATLPSQKETRSKSAAVIKAVEVQSKTQTDAPPACTQPDTPPRSDISNPKIQDTVVHGRASDLDEQHSRVEPASTLSDHPSLNHEGSVPSSPLAWGSFVNRVPCETEVSMATQNQFAPSISPAPSPASYSTAFMRGYILGSQHVGIGNLSQPDADGKVASCLDQEATPNFDAVNTDPSITSSSTNLFSNLNSPTITSTSNSEPLLSDAIYSPGEAFSASEKGYFDLDFPGTATFPPVGSFPQPETCTSSEFSSPDEYYLSINGQLFSTSPSAEFMNGGTPLTKETTSLAANTRLFSDITATSPFGYPIPPTDMAVPEAEYLSFPFDGQISGFNQDGSPSFAPDDAAIYFPWESNYSLPPNSYENCQFVTNQEYHAPKNRYRTF